MRILKFYDATNSLKLEPESFDDLYLLARIISVGDRAEAKSSRRFRGNESDVGEQKEIFVRISIEKVEIDKSANRLRLIGKILSGRPEEFVQIGQHHTINLAPGDIVEIEKAAWEDYVLKRVKQAVADSKKPKLGVIAVDEEKVTIGYIRGYGIEISTEIYSHLSKRMKEKDYAKQKELYFNEIISSIEQMNVSIVVIAGPGFTKDDIKRYIKDNSIEVKKRLEYAPTSDAERSGIREVVQSGMVSELLENENIKKEFEHLNLFLNALRVNASLTGVEKIEDALASYTIGIILVNDSVLNNERIKKLLENADKQGIKIEIFNADDEAGMQLKNFKDIVAISKSFMK